MNQEVANSEAANDRPSWGEVADASADAERWEEETVEDSIDVALTTEDKAEIAGLITVDDETRSALEAELDALKASAKEKKSEIAAVNAKIKEHCRHLRDGKRPVRGTFKVATCFSLNLVRYIDPETGRVLLERPCTPSERQLSLGVVEGGEVISLADARKSGDAAAGDGTSIDDPSALLDAAKRGEATEPEDESLDGEDENDDLDGEP